jgi:hypothetical protein
MILDADFSDDLVTKLSPPKSIDLRMSDNRTTASAAEHEWRYLRHGVDR